MEYKDYYKTLNVAKNASDDEIKKSYRKLARKYHPDVSKEKNAEDKFKEVKEAYEVLKDPQKRQAYDNMGSNWNAGAHGGGFHGGGFEQQFSGGDFSDFFESMFGQGQGRSGFHQQRQPRQQRGHDQTSQVTISLEDAYGGTHIDLNLRTQNNKSKQLKVKIPAGVTTGQQIRLSGQGAPGMNGGPNGDLLLEITIRQHHLYKLDNKDIYLNLPITPWEAALGATIETPTLAGRVGLKIPAGSQSGKKMRLKGRGMPGKQVGDQFVILMINTPEITSDADRRLYEQFAQQTQYNPRIKLM